MQRQFYCTTVLLGATSSVCDKPPTCFVIYNPERFSAFSTILSAREALHKPILVHEPILRRHCCERGSCAMHQHCSLCVHLFIISVHGHGHAEPGRSAAVLVSKDLTNSCFPNVLRHPRTKENQRQRNTHRSTYVLYIS